MVLVKREIYVLFRIIASCATAAALIFFISPLSGEDSRTSNRRVAQLGEVPEKNPFRKFYCVELAKEIHELSNLTEKQRMLFDTYNVRSFEVQLKRMMEQTENSDVKGLMDELEVVKRELKNSTNLLEKNENKLIRQRTAYIVLFIVFWLVLYLYYSRGIIFRKSQAD